MNPEQTLAALYETAKDGAIDILRDSREPKPIVLAVQDNEIFAMPYAGSRDEMRAALAFAAETFEQFVAVHCAWTASAAEVEKYGCPEKCPEHRQGVIVNAYAKGKRVCTGFLEFRGDKEHGFTWDEAWKETGTTFDMVSTPEQGSIFP